MRIPNRLLTYSLILCFPLVSAYAQNKLDIPNPKNDKELLDIRQGMKDLKAELRSLPSFKPKKIKGGDQLMACFSDIKEALSDTESCLQKKYDYYQGQIDQAEEKISSWEETQEQKMKAYEAGYNENQRKLAALKDVKISGIGKKSLKDTQAKIEKEMRDNKVAYFHDLKRTKDQMKGSVYTGLNSALSGVLEKDLAKREEEARKGVANERASELSRLKASLHDLYVVNRNVKETWIVDAAEEYKHYTYVSRELERLIRTYGPRVKDFYKGFSMKELSSCVKPLNSFGRYDQVEFYPCLYRKLETQYEKKVKEVEERKRPLEYAKPGSFECFENHSLLAKSCKTSLCTSIVGEYVSSAYTQLGKNSKKIYKLFALEDKKKVDVLITDSLSKVGQSTALKGAGLPPADFTKAVEGCDEKAIASVNEEGRSIGKEIVTDDKNLKVKVKGATQQ